MGMSMNVTMKQNNNRGLRHGGVSCREHLLTGGWSFSRSTWCESPNCLEFGFILWMLKFYNVFDERVVSIRESVDSLCRDGADTPMPPYIGKAFTRTNFEDLSLFRYMIMVCE